MVSAFAETGAAHNPHAEALESDATSSPSSSRQSYWETKRRAPRSIDDLMVSFFAETGAAQNVVSSHSARAWKLDVESPRSSRQGNSKLKRGLSGTIDGFKVSALADTGAALNVVSCSFAKARGLDVAGSPSSFRQGNSTSAYSLGTSKYRCDKMTK